jgi:hypothetical protein
MSAVLLHGEFNNLILDARAHCLLATAVGGGGPVKVASVGANTTADNIVVMIITSSIGNGNDIIIVIIAVVMFIAMFIIMRVLFSQVEWRDTNNNMPRHSGL